MAPAILITEQALRTIAPGAAPDIVAGIVKHQSLLARYGLTEVKDVNHFLAQCAAETTGFTRLEENLFYTTESRLMAVWPSRFRTKASATPYLRNPEKLANFVYGGRGGNTKPGDGWKYRGSGCKQTTFFNNYLAVERATGLPVTARPEMLRRFSEALESACIYWRDNNLVRFARADDIAGLTRAIQGGTGGLADRRIYAERAGRVDWQSGKAPVAPAVPEPESEPVLRRGDKGEAVRRAQLYLSKNGFEIRIDGDFGSGTDNLVREFQEQRGLMADGVIGAKTWAALRAPKPPETETPGRRGLIDIIITLIAALFGRRGN